MWKQLAIDVKSLGTDRLGTEGAIKEYRRKYFCLSCTFETFRLMVLVVGVGESQDQETWKETPPLGIGGEI